MRDLANSSARSAIDRYAQTKWLTSAVAKLTMSILAAAAAIFLGFFAEGHPLLIYGGGVFSAVWSICWLVLAVRYTGRFFRARSEKQQPTPSRASAAQDNTP
jgi:hypothetical protein